MSQPKTVIITGASSGIGLALAEAYVRRGDRVYALAETCAHLGGPLSEGKLEGDTVVCPWHASRFTLETGEVVDGPSAFPQPCLKTRIRNGQIEVKK